ncbi:hypothetical protein B296_00018609 [Ensete ventricosum]|uniref:Uncharacterized protein n=1 Tax=Ensete ventricosum TaxID=4639 RepID=A0A427A263_ENSVE|nr:hypothetical protein B296_00018609 [Ensete ventricosum]
MLDELGKGLLTPLAQAGEQGGSGLRGPPSSAKNVVGYFAVAGESARLGPARVRKVVRVGRVLPCQVDCRHGALSLTRNG